MRGKGEGDRERKEGTRGKGEGDRERKEGTRGKIHIKHILTTTHMHYTHV